LLFRRRRGSTVASARVPLSGLFDSRIVAFVVRDNLHRPTMTALPSDASGFKLYNWAAVVHRKYSSRLNGLPRPFIPGLKMASSPVSLLQVPIQMDDATWFF